MTILPYTQTPISYHATWDRDLQEWVMYTDEAGNKVRSNICICKATQTSECKCGAWNEYWDNLLEIEEIY